MVYLSEQAEEKPPGVQLTHVHLEKRLLKREVGRWVGRKCYANFLKVSQKK